MLLSGVVLLVGMIGAGFAAWDRKTIRRLLGRDGVAGLRGTRAARRVSR